MTEEESVDQFVDETISKARVWGTNAAVTMVLLAAIRAAAGIAVRTASGEIDSDNAEEILRDAANLLRNV